MKQSVIYLWIFVFFGVGAMDGSDEAYSSGAAQGRAISMPPMQPFPSQEPPAIPAIAYNALPGVTPEGLENINEFLRVNWNNLEEAQKRKIFLYASTGNFSPSPWMNYFWRFTRAVSNPLHHLGMLVCAIMPMVSVYAEHERLNFIVSLSAVSSIFFGKVDGYANAKIASYEELLLYLRALQEHHQAPHPEIEA
ncbi:MAG: hypothetical protein LBC04_04230 [Holosporaceae bacterium]|jgi:hypothetical protein|nr:hypothetical protein [Holosporaceae bacterium]